MKRPWTVLGTTLAITMLAYGGYAWASPRSIHDLPATPDEGEARSPSLPPVNSGEANLVEAHGRQSAVETVKTNPLPPESAAAQPASSVGTASAPTIADSSIAHVHARLLERMKRLESDSANGGRVSATQKDGLAVDKAAMKLIEAQRYWYLGPAEQMPAYLHLNTRSTRFWSTSTKDGRVIVLEMTSYEFPEVFENDPRAF